MESQKNQRTKCWTTVPIKKVYVETVCLHDFCDSCEIFNFALFCRNIKIFPKSITRIELHAKSNRLYAQCINDPFVYAIEITSGVVIQTIKYADEGHASFELRNTFTVSPCGTLIFTKCLNEDQIKCIRVSNDEQIGQFRIPISLATRKYSVTSLTYHPDKNLMACSIFGDVINSCLFMMYSECDSRKEEHDFVNRYDVDLEPNFHTLDEWRTNRTHAINGDDFNTGIGIKSILNRIDDLFFMAIRSPQNDDGIDQFKEMQQFFDKFHMESSQMIGDGNENMASHSQNQVVEQSDKIDAHSNEISSASGESKKGDFKSNSLFEKSTGRKSWQLQSTTKLSSKSNNDSLSDSSNHTIEDSQPYKETNRTKNSDDHELSNATYSIESNTSKRSNLTFEISTAKK